MIKEILEKLKKKRLAINDLSEQVRIQKMVEDRQKSANERELERFLSEEREKEIKLRLEQFRKQKKVESMENNILKGKNIFKGHKSILKDKKLFSTKGGMFFTHKGGFI